MYFTISCEVAIVAALAIFCIAFYSFLRGKKRFNQLQAQVLFSENFAQAFENFWVIWSENQKSQMKWGITALLLRSQYIYLESACRTEFLRQLDALKFFGFGNDDAISFYQQWRSIHSYHFTPDLPYTTMLYELERKEKFCLVDKSASKMVFLKFLVEARKLYQSKVNELLEAYLSAANLLTLNERILFLNLISKDYGSTSTPFYSMHDFCRSFVINNENKICRKIKTFIDGVKSKKPDNYGLLQGYEPYLNSKFFSDQVKDYQLAMFSISKEMSKEYQQVLFNALLAEKNPQKFAFWYKKITNSKNLKALEQKALEMGVIEAPTV